MSERFGIWSKTTDSWVYDDEGDCTFDTQRKASSALKDMTWKDNKDDYEVREYA